MNVYYSLFIETRAKRERERGGRHGMILYMYACVIAHALYWLVWACVYNVWCV